MTISVNSLQGFDVNEIKMNKALFRLSKKGTFGNPKKKKKNNKETTNKSNLREQIPFPLFFSAAEKKALAD